MLLVYLNVIEVVQSGADALVYLDLALVIERVEFFRRDVAIVLPVFTVTFALN